MQKNLISEALLVILFSIINLSCSCNPVPCEQLPKIYSSYEDAIASIKAASFKVEESVDTSKSSWILKAYFYSCDGATGYFILETDKQEYIHSKMPIEIWEAFKKAESFGEFYNKQIKHNFQFKLSE